MTKIEKCISIKIDWIENGYKENTKQALNSLTLGICNVKKNKLNYIKMSIEKISCQLFWDSNQFQCIDSIDRLTILNPLLAKSFKW